MRALSKGKKDCGKSKGQVPCCHRISSLGERRPAEILCYTFAHECNQSKKICYAMRECGGWSVAFAKDGTGSGIGAFRELPCLSAGSSCGGGLSVSRVYRGMEGV